jgi:hypothetical protein
MLNRSSFAEYKRTAAVVDRLTFRAHIVETGTDSYRLRTARAKKNTTRTTNAAEGDHDGR